MQYNKVLISLSGNSSKIQNPTLIRKNIFRALTLLGLPGEILPYIDGHENFEAALNQDGVLYILNDSLSFHYCKKPKVLICRTAPWVQSEDDKWTLGRITQEMLEIEYAELAGIIARNQFRKPKGPQDRKTFLLYSEYFPKTTDAMGRNSLAKFSWSALKTNDKSLEILPYVSNGIPYLNQMILEGMQYLKGSDDILILINSDICLVEGATGIIRTFMEARNIAECYAQRVDVMATSPLQVRDLLPYYPHEGADIFAFKKGSKALEKLSTIPLLIGRAGWDVAWAFEVKHALPYNIAHHWPHESDWLKEEGAQGNAFNIKQIFANFPNIDYHAIFGSPIFCFRY